MGENSPVGGNCSFQAFFKSHESVLGAGCVCVCVCVCPRLLSSSLGRLRNRCPSIFAMAEEAESGIFYLTESYSPIWQGFGV